MSHLLVTNDFPPKVGGIQSYLWELWRRLPPERVTVLTTPYSGAGRFDAEQAFAVHRTRTPVLLPTPGLARHINKLADRAGAKLIVLDPALPVGALGPYLDRPYALVLHGAEVTVPARLPGSRQALRPTLAKADLLIAAGGYPATEAAALLGHDAPPIVNVPPGVDTRRFRPLSDDERRAARARFGLPEDAPVVVSISRLVRRKGMDVLIDAIAQVQHRHPSVHLAIGGTGRDEARLRSHARDSHARDSHASVTFLGRVPETDLPALYGCADVFAMLCHNRWGGLEQEGFGIVFLEAAACGVAQVAGDSGGARDAVADGETGVVVRTPRDPAATARVLGGLLAEPAERRGMGARARARAVAEFDYDVLAARLDAALKEHGG